MEAIALNSIRRVGEFGLKGDYIRGRMENYASLQRMKEYAQKEGSEEGKDILKRYAVLNRRFEERVSREIREEMTKEKKWDDEGLEEAKLEEEKKEEGRWLGGWLGKWWSGEEENKGKEKEEEEEKIGKKDRTQRENVRKQRNSKSDDLSNLFWNMSGANVV